MRGELQSALEISDAVAQQIFRLLPGGPRAAAQRARALAGGLRARFTLNQLDVGIVEVAQRPQRPRVALSIELVGRIAVIGERVDRAAHAGSQRVADEGQPPVAAARYAADDLRAFIAFARGFGCGGGKFAVFLRIHAVFPAAAAVRLVPDLVILDAALEVLGGCLHIVVPGRALFLGKDGRAADRAKDGFRRLGIQIVAIAQADPRNHAAADEVVHDVVQPRKVVNALFTLRALPAGLKAHPFHAQRGHLVVGLFGIEHVSVQLFKADAQLRGLDLQRGFGGDFADGNQSVHSHFSF